MKWILAALVILLVVICGKELLITAEIIATHASLVSELGELTTDDNALAVDRYTHTMVRDFKKLERKHWQLVFIELGAIILTLLWLVLLVWVGRRRKRRNAEPDERGAAAGAPGAAV